MSQIYYDAEGNEISLYKLVRQDPDWAMSRVQVSREQAEEIERLKAELEVERAENASLESDVSWHENDEAKMSARITELEQALHDRSSERDTAIGMLADWCVAVELNGASWDDWDEHYKNASFRPCGIRDLLDVAIYERKPMERKQ